MAWADMISMKALEVSENFLMSTGLGTLWENRDSEKPRGSPRAAGQEEKLDRVGQRGPVLS